MLSTRAHFGTTPVATRSGSAVSRPQSVVGRAKSVSASARASSRRRRSAATRRSWRGTDDGALGDLVEVVALVDALVAHEARDEVRRLAQQAERGAEAARRAEVVRDGDGEGVLVDDAVPPAARHEDDVAGPAVRLDEVRMCFRLGVERARPPAW